MAARHHHRSLPQKERKVKDEDEDYGGVIEDAIERRPANKTKDRRNNLRAGPAKGP
jgi:hypothetical protein